MKEKNWFSKNPLLIIGIIIIAGIVLFFMFRGTNTNDANSSQTQSSTKNVAGLNDSIKIGDLSFKLFNVNLQKWKEKDMFTTEVNGNIIAKIYSMYWFLEVTNNGDNIEYVSNCGTLLFEDGSQYSFMPQTTTTRCGDYKIVPGATIKIMSSFFFSDDYLYKGSAKPWEQVHGSKITYFSEQTSGLVKYIIDKSEIKYTESDV